jgi:hypothetical protein
MSTENLVNIDIESDGTQNEHELEISANCKNNRSYSKVLSDDSEIIFSCDNSLDECDRLANESQPLLGGLDHDGHQIYYNQFPSE